MTSKAWLLLVVSLGACATPAPPLTAPFDIGVKDLRLRPRALSLPSGLRLVHERVEGSGAVALVLTIRAGAARDPEGRRGLAHLVEHLTFRARDDAGRTRWDRYEQLGATRINGFTDHESTIYVSVVPKASMAAAVRLEAERIAAPLGGITERDLALERDIVRNEIFERNERNQEGGLMSWAARALFPPGHRYRHAIGGTSETLAAIVERDARWFTLTHYRPRNATLTVVGDVTSQELLEAVEGVGRLASAGENQPVPDPLPDLVEVPLHPPDPPPGPVAREQGSWRGPRVWIAWTLPGTFGPAAGAGELVARVLNNTVDQDFLRVLGEPGADVAEVGFFIAPGLMASTLIAEAHLRDGHWPERSASAIIEGVVALSRPASSAADRVMLQSTIGVVSGLLMQNEDLLARATRYAEADRVTGDARNAVQRLRRLFETEPDHVRSYFAAYLTRERARVAVVTPRKNPARAGLPMIGLDPSLSQATTSEGDAGGAASGGTPAAPPMAPLPSPAGSVHRFRLPNGLEVVIWPRPGFPSVTASLMFRGGRAASNPAGAELYLDELLPLLYCAGIPANRGISISTDVQPDAVIETAQGGAGNLSAILLALVERAAVYRFDEWPVLKTLHQQTCPQVSPREELGRLWSEVLASGKRRLEQRRLTTGRSASRQAARALDRALSGGTPYEPPPASDLDGVTAEQLEDWYASSRRPENAVLVMVGQVDPAEGERLARGWFGSWRPGAAVRPARSPPVAGGVRPQAPRLYRLAEAGASQAEILVGCRLSSATAPEAAAAQVLARVLARDLRRRLREQLAATYGVDERLMEFKTGTTLLTLGTDVGREHLQTALTQLVGRIDALAGRPPSGAELRRAQLDVFRDLAGPASSARLTFQAVRLLSLGQPIEELDRAPVEIARVTAATVQAAAAACRRTLNVAAVADPEALASAALPGFVVEELR